VVPKWEVVGQRLFTKKKHDLCSAERFLLKLEIMFSLFLFFFGKKTHFHFIEFKSEGSYNHRVNFEVTVT
jgi:hypothetical protein